VAEPVERLVNLAFCLADARIPKSAERIRAEVEGYPAEQDEPAFLRMFERDKESLREAGFVIDTTPDGLYSLDAAATFASQVELGPEDVMLLQAVGLAMLEDPGFPFSDELRLALAKVATSEDGAFSALGGLDAPLTARLADERPEDQAALVALLDQAVTSRKRTTFEYQNAKGEDKHHEVEPYGVFMHNGGWYLVGRDVERDETRVYALARAGELAMNASRPKSPDFEPPADFDVSRFIGLPFQYGDAEPFEAQVRFDPAHAWRAEGLSAGSGRIEREANGFATWYVTARDERRLLRWVVENGPGLVPVSPPHLAEKLAESLAKVGALHG
jgi:proteasome accessory factor B